MDPTHPSIYYEADTVQVRGRWLPRMAYLWCYSVAPTNSASSRLRFQGVRITLSSDGEPVIWEVLADGTFARLVFVAQSLELAAAAESGKPLSQRQHAIEQSLAPAPRTVVARVIDDGPVPMGPILYLRVASHDVSTLICRCMPAQAKSVRESLTYELLSLTEPAHRTLVNEARAQTGAPDWPAVPELRMPAGQ